MWNFAQRLRLDVFGQHNQFWGGYRVYRVNAASRITRRFGVLHAEKPAKYNNIFAPLNQSARRWGDAQTLGEHYACAYICIMFTWWAKRNQSVNCDKTENKRTRGIRCWSYDREVCVIGEMSYIVSSPYYIKSLLYHLRTVECVSL